MREYLRENILARFNQLRAFFDQPIGSAASLGADISRNRKNLSSLIEGILSRNQRPARLACLDDHHSDRQTTDDPIPPWKMNPFRRRSHRKLRKDRSLGNDLSKEIPILGWIDDINAAAQHSNGPSSS
jgi:hypothetical protein